ncbi:MAG: ATP-binding protein [Acidimicrobiales bacterium]
MVATPQGPLTVTSYVALDEVGRSVDALRSRLLVGVPVSVAIVGLVAWWLVGLALRPVEAIRLEAEAIGGSSLHRRVPVPGSGDEVGRLSRTMNAMLERLEGAVRRQRQFVADASHELRSPIAAIRTDLEVALHEGEGADWLNVARATPAEEARLEVLLDDLLLLAAEDEGAVATAGMPGVPVDLGELAAEEAAPSRRVPVEVVAAREPDGCPPAVTGSRNQLRRALANLVDNATRHAHRRVRVAVGYAEGEERVEVAVDDDGPGIPPGDRERVFDRFTRLDDGRSRDQRGAGLGLAVVRSIVARHRGRVWATDSHLRHA